MWLAAEPGDGALVTAVWAFLGIVVTQLVYLIAPVVKAKFERQATPTASEPATESLTPILMDLAKQQGQLVQRADDADDAIDMIDRARTQDRDDLDDVLGYLDRNEPDWRNR